MNVISAQLVIQPLVVRVNIRPLVARPHVVRVNRRPLVARVAGVRRVRIVNKEKEHSKPYYKAEVEPQTTIEEPEVKDEKVRKKIPRPRKKSQINKEGGE